MDIRQHNFKWWQWPIYTLQMLLAVFVATVLIANICGTPISSCLIGAAIGTLIYEIATGFKSPMFISSCGATVSAVVGALALGGSGNYIAVAIGGVIILLVYIGFAMIIKFGGKKTFDKIFPPVIVGPITIVIGLNLAGFLPSYIGSGDSSWIAMLVALGTMLTTALVSHYAKGFMKTIAFLFGIMFGYICAVILEFSGAYNFGIEKALTSWTWFNVKDFAFMQWASSPFEWSQLPDIILLFLPVSICAALEHYSDHKALSNIIGTDLTINPGLDRSLIGDGVASAAGTIIGGLPNTSYGESIATIGFSRVASVWITMSAAILLGCLGFIAPVTAFINSIPSAVFGGCAMILYGYIAVSGLKLIVNSKPNLDGSHDLIIISVILTVGVSGIYLYSESFTGVALAMILGVILNLILREKHTQISK